MGETIDNQSII